MDKLARLSFAVHPTIKPHSSLELKRKPSWGESVVYMPPIEDGLKITFSAFSYEGGRYLVVADAYDNMIIVAVNFPMTCPAEDPRDLYSDSPARELLYRAFVMLYEKVEHRLLTMVEYLVKNGTSYCAVFSEGGDLHFYAITHPGSAVTWGNPRVAQDEFRIVNIPQYHGHLFSEDTVDKLLATLANNGISTGNIYSLDEYGSVLGIVAV